MYLGSSIILEKSSRVAIILGDIRNPIFYSYLWQIVGSLERQNCQISIVDIPSRITGTGYKGNTFQRKLIKVDDGELARIKLNFINEVLGKFKSTSLINCKSQEAALRCESKAISLMQVLNDKSFSDLLKSSVASMYQTKISKSIDLSICPKRYWKDVGEMVSSFLSTKEFLSRIDLQSKCDAVVYLNGRKPHQAACIEYAKDWNLREYSLEHNVFESKFNSFHFEPFLPQDFVSLQENYIKLKRVNDAKGQIPQAEINKWFHNQRKSGPSFGPKGIKIEVTPGSDARTTFVIFTSTLSEYDYMLQQQDNSWSQFDALREVALKIKSEFPNARIIVRIHPNQRNFSWHDLLTLNRTLRTLNVEVVQPWDGTTSYSILDLADYVVVWNSTIGLEAIYWGKKTVCLSNTFYNLITDMPQLSPKNLEIFSFKHAVYPSPGVAVEALDFMLNSGEELKEDQDFNQIRNALEPTFVKQVQSAPTRGIFLQLQYLVDGSYFGKLGHPVLLERLLTKFFNYRIACNSLNMIVRCLSTVKSK